MTGIRITEVTYKGAGPAVTALMAGEVQVAMEPVGATQQFVRAGRLKALAIASTFEGDYSDRGGGFILAASLDEAGTWDSRYGANYRFSF